MKYLILIFSIVILIGCNQTTYNSTEVNGQNKVNKEYSELLSNFRKFQIDHLPVTLDSNFIYNRWSLDPEDEISIELGCHMSRDEIRITIDNVNIIAEYHPNDSCLFILNRYATKKNYNILDSDTINKELISRDCYKYKFPIPNFWTSKYYFEDNECHLPNDFKILVIEARPGMYLDKDMLTKGKYMPNEWKNGFSKGLAISEEREVIIYWTIVW